MDRETAEILSRSAELCARSAELQDRIAGLVRRGARLRGLPGRIRAHHKCCPQKHDRSNYAERPRQPAGCGRVVTGDGLTEISQTRSGRGGELGRHSGDSVVSSIGLGGYLRRFALRASVNFRPPVMRVHQGAPARR
jgi:hypothetical protein